MKNLYPHKEEILKGIFTPKENLTKTIQTWQKEFWKESKKKGEEERFFALKGLIQQLATLHDNPVKVEYRPSLASCCYVPTIKTIFLNNSLSIISSLHELSHHLAGSSELTACIWSISLFKAAFPKAYNKLEWKGHLLIRGKAS